jgi:alpha/beta superfamily hydrolase
MSADPRIEPGFEACEGAEALYFESGEHTLFGWLHLPRDGKHGDVGIVICKPFGYEAICSHRSVRAFAEMSTALGAPTLRFDYLGSGDSGDIDPEADQLDTWTQDVVAAISAMQSRTGVSRICMLGIRLGATLATLAAARCPAVSSLILIAPIISGRRYLKELRTTRLAASLLPGGSDAASNPGSMEVSGFYFSEKTLASLGRVDVGSGGVPSISEMLVVDGSSFPASRAWTEKLSAVGVPIAYQALPGLVEMTFTAPQFALVPQEMVAAVRAWLLQFPLAPSGKRAALALPPAQVAPALHLPHGPNAEQSITERPVFFGSEAALFGVVTEPHVGELRRRAVILLNAGADFHIGSSGINVGLARSWARRGYVVLRMDFAGIGDSSTRPGRPDNEVFPPAAVEDIRAAIEYMRGRYDVRDLTVAGTCSGAYHALQSAVAALPVDRILMVNPQNYFWNEGMSIHGIQIAELVSTPSGAARAKMLSLDWWRRLLTGQVNVWYLTKLFAKRIGLSVESTLRNAARTLRIRLPNDLGWELETIAARGVRIVFVFSRGEPGIDLLRMQAGKSLKRLGERYSMHIIDGADHVFSKLGPRTELEKILSDELYARTDWKVLNNARLASQADKCVSVGKQ